MLTKEIEIKLLISEKAIDAFFTHSILANATMRPLHHCYSTYYDTTEHELSKQGFALRLREDNGQFVQTLKGAHQNDLTANNGLHERPEWEWALSSDQLDLDLLPDDIQPFVKGLALQPVFITDFMRQSWDLHVNHQHIEIALDRGEIRIGSFKESICEVELEIKAGDKKGLIALAETFKQSIPLKPFNVSKAERGYRLHTIYQSNQSA